MIIQFKNCLNRHLSGNTNSQQRHEKSFKVTNQQGRANQNHNERLTLVIKQHIQERMWRKENAYTADRM